MKGFAMDKSDVVQVVLGTLVIACQLVAHPLGADPWLGMVTAWCVVCAGRHRYRARVEGGLT